jgi:hypothetical protein
LPPALNYGTQVWVELLDWICCFPKCRTCGYNGRLRLFESYQKSPTVRGYQDAVLGHMLYFEFESMQDSKEGVRTRNKEALRFQYPALELPAFASGASVRNPKTQPGKI